MRRAVMLVVMVHRPSIEGCGLIKGARHCCVNPIGVIDLSRQKYDKESISFFRCLY